MDDRRESVVEATKTCQNFIRELGVENVMTEEGKSAFGRRIKSEYVFEWFSDNNQSRNGVQAEVINDFDAEFKHIKSVYEIAKTDPELAKAICEKIAALSKSDNIADKRAADMLATYFLQDETHGAFPSPTSCIHQVTKTINGELATQAENMFLARDSDYKPYDADKFVTADKLLEKEIDNQNGLGAAFRKIAQGAVEFVGDAYKFVEDVNAQVIAEQKNGARE